MRKALLGTAAAIAIAAALSGCSSGPPRQQQRHEEEWHAPVQILLRFADKDGKLTRAELEAGLRKDFDVADLNHDGMLEPDEVRAVNEKRWEEDKSAASPLIDWKGNGLIDFDEFAATARALFDEYDRNHDGVLTREELRPAQAPPPAPGGGEGRPRERRSGGEDGQ